MNKMMKQFIHPILFLALTLPAFSQIGVPGDGPAMGKDNIFQELQLTSEQEDQMRTLRYNLEKKLIQLQANLKTEQLELKKLKQADEPNKKKIHAQIEKVGQERIALEKARADHHLEIRKILTVEQYRKFKGDTKARGGRKGHFGQGKGGRFKDGPGHFRK
jgi:Spy/CpxP family protein refolding chaperone